MIELHIKSKSNESKEATNLANAFHDALKGWDAYVNSDVLLNVDDTKDLLLLIGPDSSHTVRVDVNLSDVNVGSESKSKLRTFIKEKLNRIIGASILTFLVLIFDAFLALGLSSDTSIGFIGSFAISIGITILIAAIILSGVFAMSLIEDSK